MTVQYMDGTHDFQDLLPREYVYSILKDQFTLTVYIIWGFMYICGIGSAEKLDSCYRSWIK